jgi:acetyltransferase-like isoleucine patch superfamily enzyme
MDNLPTRPPGTKPGKRPGNQFGRQLHGHTNSIPVEERLRRTQELLADDLVLQRLAKQMVESGFRNRLEDIHAGIIPSSKTGDGTDIVVTLFLAKITIGCRIKYINRVSNSALSHVKLALCSAH